MGGLNDPAFVCLRKSGVRALARLSILMAAACAPAYADGSPVRVRGAVVSLDGSKLVVHAKDGKDVTISLKDKYAVLAVVKSSIADIKEGTFIGTATVAQPDGSLRAVEVVVFPDSLRGFGEGHYPWDLGPSSMMTNATVANAVKSVEGQTVTATYKGGEKKIDIPGECADRSGWSPPTRAISRQARLFLFLPRNKPTAHWSAARCCSARTA